MHQFVCIYTYSKQTSDDCPDKMMEITFKQTSQFLLTYLHLSIHYTINLTVQCDECQDMSSSAHTELGLEVYLKVYACMHVDYSDYTSVAVNNTCNYNSTV